MTNQFFERNFRESSSHSITGNNGNNKEIFTRIAGVVTRLTVLVILTLIVSVFVLLLLIVLLAVLFWHRRKKNMKPPIYLGVSKLSLSLSA
jgi:Flp pilus assembly protein TadB